MAYWLKVILWTLLGVVVSCSLAIGVVAFAINRIYGRNEAEDARLAPIIIEETMEGCSISPSRNFVLTRNSMDFKVYNLKTGDRINYPAPPQDHGYGVTQGWMNNSTQDIALVSPHWMVNLTTGVVTKTDVIDLNQPPLWWLPLLIPENSEIYVKSPDQQYVAHSVQISRSVIGKWPVGESIVSFANDHPTICTNAWDPDSSGYYFIDTQGRGRSPDPGPLRFLKNPER